MSVGNRFEKRSLKIFSVSLSAKDRIKIQYYFYAILLSSRQDRELLPQSKILKGQ